MPGGGTAAGGVGGGNTSEMSDQEAAMVKAVSQPPCNEGLRPS